MRLPATGPGSNSAHSSAVEMCSTCRRVPCLRASEIASRVDLMHASRERISGCCAIGMSSPQRAFAASSLAVIVGVSSQCVMIGTGQSRKIASSVAGSSTSMLPVDAPMNTLTPGADFGSSARMSARLSLVAPR
jgi:hypothetical protein